MLSATKLVDMFVLGILIGHLLTYVLMKKEGK